MLPLKYRKTQLFRIITFISLLEKKNDCEIEMKKASIKLKSYKNERK